MTLQQLYILSALKNKYVSYFFGGMLNFFAHNIEYIGQKAIISKPVIDMSSSYPVCDKPAISGQEKLCRRANQGLYNEVVTSLNIVADAVKIKFDYDLIYGFDENNQPYSTFWTLADGIILLKKINPILISMIPSLKNEAQPKLCLTTPWRFFSVGTYFVRIPSKDNDNYYAVYVPYFTDNAFTIEYIEKEKTLCVEKRSMEEQRFLFVKLLHELIEHASSQQKNGVVSYVWGGCSYTNSNDNDDFFYAQGAWYRPLHGETYQGYDCSGLIWRLAQSVGIQFPWKVTKMMSEHCRLVDEHNPLENGDIIWFEGHTMIVGSIQDNTIIEAAGYSSGYGCVHCIPLEKRFAGINTYEDLINAYCNQEAISLLDSHGNQLKKVHIKLLKLMPPYQ